MTARQDDLVNELYLLGQMWAWSGKRLEDVLGADLFLRVTSVLGVGGSTTEISRVLNEVRWKRFERAKAIYEAVYRDRAPTIVCGADSVRITKRNPEPPRN